MAYDKLSAIELQRDIDRAEHYAEDSGPELWNALKEIDRLREICQDIVETIDTDPDFIYVGGDRDRGIAKLHNIAHEYFRPERG